MITLPAARKEWCCKEKDDQGRQCDQRLYQDPDKKFGSGKMMVLNADNGRGGKRGDPHVCPDRVNGQFHKGDNFFNKFEYRLKQQYKFCGECAEYFNTDKFPLCPHCFKLECRRCNGFQVWIAGKDNMKCNSCGAIGMDVRQVWTAYERLYGIYEERKMKPSLLHA